MNLVPIVLFGRRPLLSDTRYNIGTQVILGSNPTTGSKGELWYLSEFNSSGQAVWIRFDSQSHDPNHLPWTVITSSTYQAEVNNGYFANYAGTLVFTLPAVSAVGDTIIFTNINTNFRINQNSGQIINIGNQPTTRGVSGYIQSTDVGDSITLTCSVANADFWVTGGIQGNITIF
jgi:hypothetical protein